MSKTANYTEQQVSKMVAAYQSASDQESRDDVVTTFAEEFGKSVASIRAKLSREGVYVKKAYAKKDGSESIRKAAKVARIAARCGATLEAFDSLEKATHAVLDKLLENLS